MHHTIQPYLRQVNYYETDKMGIVHHSNYIRWFEEARIDYLEQAGFDYCPVEETGILIPVLSYTCINKKPTRFHDQLSISVRLTKFNSVRFSVRYEVRFRDTGVLAAVGETTHCFLNQAMQPIVLKRKRPDVDELMHALLRAEQARECAIP